MKYIRLCQFLTSADKKMSEKYKNNIWEKFFLIDLKSIYLWIQRKRISEMNDLMSRYWVRHGRKNLERSRYVKTYRRAIFNIFNVFAINGATLGFRFLLATSASYCDDDGRQIIFVRSSGWASMFRREATNSSAEGISRRPVPYLICCRRTSRGALATANIAWRTEKNNANIIFKAKNLTASLSLSNQVHVRFY